MPLKCIIVDDQPLVIRYLTREIQNRYGSLFEIRGFRSPQDAIPFLDHEVDILIMDFEMPSMPGTQFLKTAIDRGVDRSRIIILSSHNPDDIRHEIPLGHVLAVINKADREQQEILKMILDAIVKRSRSKRPWPGTSSH